MKFDKSKIYTAANADELKIGSKIVVADTLGELKQCVLKERPEKLVEVLNEDNQCRFKIGNNSSEYALAYLVSEPEEKKLKWTDLKVGDVIRKGTQESMILAIDRAEDSHYHISICAYKGYSTDLFWIGDKEIEEWEKVND